MLIITTSQFPLYTSLLGTSTNRLHKPLSTVLVALVAFALRRPACPKLPQCQLIKQVRQPSIHRSFQHRLTATDYTSFSVE